MRTLILILLLVLAFTESASAGILCFGRGRARREARRANGVGILHNAPASCNGNACNFR